MCDSTETPKMSESSAVVSQRYQKLLDEVLYAVSIFYSAQMSTVLMVFDQPICLILILLTLLGIFAVCQGWVALHWGEPEHHTLWQDIVNEWLSTVTRTIAFLTLQFTMALLQKTLEPSAQGASDIFVQPLVILFLLISIVKYVACLSIEYKEGSVRCQVTGI